MQDDERTEPETGPETELGGEPAVPDTASSSGTMPGQEAGGAPWHDAEPPTRDE